MQFFKKCCKVFVIFLVGTIVVSCNKENEIPIIDPDGSIDEGTVEKILNGVSTQWGMSRDELKSYMDGYDLIEGTESDILQFKTSKSQQSFSYKLHNNKLCGSAILLPSVSNELDWDDLLKEYSYVGDLDEGRVYGNTEKNTMAVLWQPCEYDDTYSAIGFAPISSDAYEKVQPITVSTNTDVEVGFFSASVSGNVTGVDTGVEVGFLYGTTPDLSEYTSQKVSSTSNGLFSLSINGLIDEATYYYQAYALIEDVYYLGEVRSLKTGPLTYVINGKTFRMIPVLGGPQGDFSIMQTELPSNCEWQVGDVTIPAVNYNSDVAVIKSEFRRFLSILREETGINFRLPTKAEWEYAAKGGNKSKGYRYSGSNNIDDVAWYVDNSEKHVHDIAEKSPNELELYDMSGNYAELTNDKTSDDVNVDGAFCGGSWKDAASQCTTESWKEGLTSGKIPDSRLQEKNAFDARYIAIRLVYSR